MGWDKLSSANGINDAGQIVGMGRLPGYTNIHAFLLTPDGTQVLGVIVPQVERIPFVEADTTVENRPSAEMWPLWQLLQIAERSTPSASLTCPSRCLNTPTLPGELPSEMNACVIRWPALGYPASEVTTA
jgi:hypothetical protein